MWEMPGPLGSHRTQGLRSHCLHFSNVSLEKVDVLPNQSQHAPRKIVWCTWPALEKERGGLQPLRVTHPSHLLPEVTLRMSHESLAEVTETSDTASS